MSLDLVQVEPSGTPDACVIWLHGLGADGHDFEPVVKEFDIPRQVRYLLPHAPIRPVTINAGIRMRAWYDIDPSAPEACAPEIDESSKEVEEILAAQCQDGMPPERIVLAGFSQGGVIALRLGLRLPFRIAGLVALSTYLYDPDNLKQHASTESTATPIFLAHGSVDPMIPISRAAAAKSTLELLRYQVEWHEYGIGHSVDLSEIADISRFLSRVLA